MGDVGSPSIDAEDYVSKLINPSQMWDDDVVHSEEDEKTLNQEQTTTDIDPGLPVFNQGQASEVEDEGTQDGLQDSSGVIENGSQGNSIDSSQAGAQDRLQSNQDGEQSSSQTSTRPPISGGNKLEDTLVMSAQEFNEKRKKLTNQDKSAIFSIVMTKLPQTELQKMSLLLEDGITEEELADLVDVMNAYLEQEEVEKLLAILNKY